MILSTPPSTSPWLDSGGAGALAAAAAVLYALAALPPRWPALRRAAPLALLAAFVLHGVLLLLDIGGVGQTVAGARLGFGPVLSMTVWLVVAVYAVESRLVPLPAVRQWLGVLGIGAVLVAALFPGEMHRMSSPLAPLHFALGVSSYGLFGAAVLHGLLLDASERRMRGGAVPGAELDAWRGEPFGMPLLQLERVTFRFVEAGFAVLTATLVLGLMTPAPWRWLDHKTVFSLLAWGVFAALLVGRWRRGWRGRRATRWLYAGALLLLMAYVGSRFVLEVLLGR